MSAAVRDLAGQTFGWLTAVRLVGKHMRYGMVWAVRCRCGKQLRILGADLTKKPRRPTQRPRSCGCYGKTHRGKRYRGVGDLSGTRWRSMQKSATARGLTFNLTHVYAWELLLAQKHRCALSGVPIHLSPSSMKAGASTASLDRIDSARGYEPGNVQWVHVEINDMKSNYPEAEFVRWCRRVARYTARK